MVYLSDHRGWLYSFIEGPGLQIWFHTYCGQSACCVGLQARSHQAQPKWPKFGNDLAIRGGMALDTLATGYYVGTHGGSSTCVGSCLPRQTQHRCDIFCMDTVVLNLEGLEACIQRGRMSKLLRFCHFPQHLSPRNPNLEHQ